MTVKGGLLLWQMKSLDGVTETSRWARSMPPPLFFFLCHSRWVGGRTQAGRTWRCEEKDGVALGVFATRRLRSCPAISGTFEAARGWRRGRKGLRGTASMASSHVSLGALATEKSGQSDRRRRLRRPHSSHAPLSASAYLARYRRLWAHSLTAGRGELKKLPSAARLVGQVGRMLQGRKKQGHCPLPYFRRVLIRPQEGAFWALATTSSVIRQQRP